MKNIFLLILLFAFSAVADTNTLTDKASGETITAAYFNDIHDALSGTVVPRNSSGAPTTGGGALGSSSYRWSALYSGTGDFSGVVGIANGTAADPAIGFTSDADGTGTGIYRVSSNVLGFSVNGVRAGSFDSGKFKGETVINMTNNGSASAPIYSYDNDPNSGGYLIGTSQLGFSTASTLRMTISSSAITSTLPFLFPNGSANSPSMAFSSDADGTGTGFYRIGANNIGLSLNGAAIIDFDASRISMDVKTNVKGTADNGTGPTGYFGEQLSATNTGGTSLTNGNSVNITSVSITAGDWDVWGFCSMTGTAAVASLEVCGIGTTNTSLGTLYDGSRGIQMEGLASQDLVVPVGPLVLNLNSTTTYYLNARADFSGGTVSGGGKIWVRRRR